MSSIEVMDDLFFIERGYLNGNHFVSRSKEPILIDTAYISDFDETARSIKELDIDIRDIRLIVNTHTHCDHIGGNKIVQDKSGCDIALHKIGKHYIDTRDDWSTWWRYYNQEADFFNCTTALDDGDLIDIGPHVFEVIYTPGHASDGIVLYNRQAKVLISSDTLWESDMAVMTLRVEGSRALFFQLESLEKLKELEVDMVYPGHGRPFSDMEKAISRTKQRIEGFLHNREQLGTDLLKKIIIYTLLMGRSVKEDDFFERLMRTHWFKETVDLYFNREYQSKYDEIMQGLFDKGLVKREGDKIYSTVKP